MAASENRTEKYARVSALEELLKDLNGSLVDANENYRKDSDEHFSKIFLV